MPAPRGCRSAPGDGAESWAAAEKQAWLGVPTPAVIQGARSAPSRGELMQPFLIFTLQQEPSEWCLFSSSCPCFLLHKGKNPKGCCWRWGLCTELGRECFPSTESRERELRGSAWLPSIFSCLGFFYKHNCLLCSSSLIFFFQAHFCTQTRLFFVCLLAFFPPFSCLSGVPARYGRLTLGYHCRTTAAA